VKGFVVRRTPYGESDLILQILAQDNRFVSAFAPGARKSRRRFPHQFDLSALYLWEFSRSPQPQRLTRVVRAEIQSWKPEISARLESWARWSLVLEWIAHQDEPTVKFDELSELRDALCVETTAVSFHRFFMRQMQWHGVFPDLKVCGRCGKAAASGRVDFVLALGGLSHSECERGLLLSTITRKFLENGGAGDFSDSEQRHLSSELDLISVPYLMMQLGRPLRAQAFFEQLSAPNPSRERYQETQLS